MCRIYFDGLWEFVVSYLKANKPSAYLKRCHMKGEVDNKFTNS